jgi:hypothetical protein
MIEWFLAALRGAKMIPGLSSWAQSSIERRQLSRVARDLYGLGFLNDGIKEPLGHIANGRGAPSDLDKIAGQLRESKAEIIQTGERLREAREFIAASLGSKAARDLDDVIYEKLGPAAILPRLEQLIERNECSAQDAKGLLKAIEDFNRHLDTVHEDIRPKGRQPAPIVAKRQRRARVRTGGSQ